MSLFIYIYIYIYIYIPVTLLVYFRNTHRKIFLRVSPRCPLLITMPVIHIFSSTIMTNLKKLIGIKSRNTKQCPARRH